jgi:opacity protein-like surface antigen
MKKLIILFAVIICVMNVQRTQAQIVEEGNLVIDAYYGWPNLYKTALKTLYVDGTATSSKVGSIGPLGARFEYMLSDVVGIGAEFGYVNTFVEWRDAGFSGTTTYDYKVSAPKIHALIRMNFHFTQHDKVDAYGGFGVGYKNRSFKFESNDPDYTGGKIDSFFPVGIRLCVGVRYFFNENIGLNTEFGLGGPLLSFGVSVKI